MLHQSVTFLFSPTAVEARLHIRELTFDSTGSEPPDTGGEGGGGKRSRRDPEPYPPSQPTPTWGLNMSVSRVRPAQTATSFGCRRVTTAWTSPQASSFSSSPALSSKTRFCPLGAWSPLDWNEVVGKATEDDFSAKPGLDGSRHLNTNTYITEIFHCPKLL